jgi:EF-hand domain pair/Ribbon-helix-helix protein, copG family
MTGPRKPKKSQSVEVRISFEVKRALMEKARAEGRSASDVIRSSIDDYLADKAKERSNMIITAMKSAAVLGAATAAIVFTTVSPAPSHATSDLKSVFQMLDRDHNGVITLNEFVRDAADPAVEKMHHAHMKDAAHHAMGAAMMDAHKAKPSAAELRTHLAQMDANSDGSVSFNEFLAFHEKMKAAHPGR